MSKVSRTDWARPIFLIINKSGNVRICVDFKVTINQSCRPTSIHCLTLRRFFHHLSGGLHFLILFKINLAQVHLKMEIKESSKKHPRHTMLFRLFYIYLLYLYFILSIIVTVHDDNTHLENLYDVLERLAD